MQYKEEPKLNWEGLDDKKDITIIINIDNGCKCGCCKCKPDKL